MITLKVFLFVIIISVAKSDEDFEIMCKNIYTDLNNNTIDVLKYCSDKVCIVKCCGEDEIYHIDNNCTKSKYFESIKVITDLAAQVNYSKILYSSKNFVMILNHRNTNIECTQALPGNEKFDIHEDGTLQRLDSTSNEMVTIERLEYCIDYKIWRVAVGKYQPVPFIRQWAAPRQDEEKIRILELVAMLISSSFLLLVLVVYSLLPHLRNLIGRVLMAYIITLLPAFILKLVINIIILKPPPGFCKNLSPFLYFAALSSFFWLNIMSYDVWWGLRGHRKKRDINRRGEWVKFMWYCLYAWGAPLLITGITVALDNIDLSELPLLKPPFGDCFSSYNPAIKYYYKIPIGILIGINIVLFGLTVYNIWMIKRAVSNCEESRSSKAQTSKFSTYTKLSVIMGVSWFLELIPPNSNIWVYALVNSYNLLTGISIFFLFVFKKQILIMLCRKFNILKDFANKLETSKSSRSGTTRTTRTSSSTAKNSFKDRNQDLDLLQNGSKGEKTVV